MYSVVLFDSLLEKIYSANTLFMNVAYAEARVLKMYYLLI